MITTTTNDSRKPTCWLNYNGQVPLDPTRPFGPNTMGEQLWMVSVEYDFTIDQTRAGFSLIAPPGGAS